MISSGAFVAELAREVERGLLARPKRLPCRFFYDDAGSELFEEICALPEYYLTRAEDEILRAQAAGIVASVPDDSAFVELGSGSARKTRHVIEAGLERSRSLVYIPIDISPAALAQSARELVATFPRLTVRALAAEYGEGLRLLRAESGGPMLVLWLGSNVGNFERVEAARFLTRLSLGMAADDRLLVGIDLRKDRRVLEAAYDDSAGVTARFNKNLLVRINRDLGAAFDPDSFRHVAQYDEVAGRISMYLESRVEQEVAIPALECSVRFARGERIHTEDSYKYSLREIDELARGGGFQVDATWLDDHGRFSVNLFRPR
ncbi:MAG: L-histidine N(alpha)-methyltransferase [Planctomycetota bacterium]